MKLKKPKNKYVVVDYKPEENKQDVITQIGGQNIPIVEIKDVDLGEGADLSDDDTPKKKSSA